MQMIKLFDKIEERENKVFAFIPGLKSEVFPLTHIMIIKWDRRGERNENRRKSL